MLSADAESEISQFGEYDVILKNVCEKKNLEISYEKIGVTTLLARHKSILSWNYLDYIRSLLKEIFLPEGYPNSVSSDYLEYQLWDTCQAFCSSISGTLSMTAVMEGVGVGSAAATPISAAITWIMKDGTGMVGSILFAWIKGSKLDSDCKKWRLFADVLNDAAMCVELYVPHVMQYSMYLLCLSTAMKALVGVAGSATRAALTCHQAIQGNMADVSAKDGSQELFVNLCASLVGIVLLKNLTGTDKVWPVMCTFILLHLFFNYKAVSCLKINVFNGERYRLCLRSFLATSSIPTVEQVNRNESVILGTGNTDREIFGFDILLGASLEQAAISRNYTANDLIYLVVMFQSKNYIILPNVQANQILVSFRKSCTDIDILKGYFHAVLTAAAIGLITKKSLPYIKRKRNNSPVSRIEKILKEYTSSKRTDLYKSSSLPVSSLLSCEQVVEREFSTFCKLLVEQGWNVNKNLFLVDNWKADWRYVDDLRPVSSAAHSSKGSVSISAASVRKRASHQVPASVKQPVNYNPSNIAECLSQFIPNDIYQSIEKTVSLWCNPDWHWFNEIIGWNIRN